MYIRTGVESKDNKSFYYTDGQKKRYMQHFQ